MLVDLNILIREVQECYIHGLFPCGIVGFFVRVSRSSYLHY